MLLVHNNLLSSRPVSFINLKKKIKNKPLTVSVRNDFNHSIEITGKMLGTFVLIYSSLNWLYYRDLRKKIEDYNKNDKNK